MKIQVIFYSMYGHVYRLAEGYSPKRGTEIASTNGYMAP
jgi:hypothetical protein